MASAYSGQKRIIRGCFFIGLGLVVPGLSVFAGWEAWYVFAVLLVPFAFLVIGLGLAEVIRGAVEIARSTD